VDAPLYNARILRLAASIPHAGRLGRAQASVQRRSSVCGSRVTADAVTDCAGRITAYAQEVRACALGQASAAILGGNVVGRDSRELAAAAAELGNWLKGAGPLPPALAQGWPDLALFEPARRHPARHASILLAFEAAAAAAEAAACAPAAASPAPAGAG
jgi:NifU-like protein involved in Fe-S cluster formation